MLFLIVPVFNYHSSPMPFHPGLKKLFKLFLVKEQLVFMKKQAYLIYFVSASEDIWNLIED